MWKIFLKVKSFINKMTKKQKMLVIAIVVAFGSLLLYKIFSARENFDLTAAKKSMVLFTMKGCGHCDNMKPEWEQLVSNLGGHSEVKLVEVVKQDNETMVEQHGITGFPTIVAIDKSGDVYKTYEGDRSYTDMKRFFEEVLQS